MSSFNLRAWFYAVNCVLMSQVCLGAPSAAADEKQLEVLGTEEPGQSVNLSETELYNVSISAFRQGRADIAMQALDALLTQRPQSYTYLLSRAEVALALEEFAQAATLSDRAFWAADTSEQSYQAARLAALAHASLEQDVRAQIWLRVARQYAPNEKESQAVAKDYRFLSNRSPWSTQLSFSATPTSNVNSGSSSDTLVIGGLPFTLSGDAKALSGYEFFGSVDTHYRLHLDESSATFLQVSGHVRTYRLSSKAKEQAPDRKGSDFSDKALSFGVVHRVSVIPDQPAMSLKADVGRTWYGGEPYSHYVDFSSGQCWCNLGPYSISTTSRFRRTLFKGSSAPIKLYSVVGNLSYEFENNHAVSLGGSLARSRSTDDTSDYKAAKVFTSYSMPLTEWEMALTVGASYEDRRFDQSSYVSGQRRDIEKEVYATLKAGQVEVFGFKPVLRLTKRKKTSNVSLFNRDFMRLGLEWESAF